VGSDINQKLFEGSINSIILFWKKIRIVRTENKKHTARKLRDLYIKYGVGKSGKPPPAPVKKGKTPREIRLYMLQCVEGVGPLTARRIMEACPTFTDLQRYSGRPKELTKKVKGLKMRSAVIISRVFEYI